MSVYLDNKVEISVIIPAYNEEKKIADSIRSIKKQKFANMEIIVGDGGSTDNTVEIARKLGAKVVIKRKKGIAVGRDAGASVAKGKILYFLDADSALRPGTLSGVKAAFRDKSVVVATGPIYTLEKTTNTIQMLYRWNYIRLVKLSMAMGKPSFIGSNLAIRRDIFKKINGFNEKLLNYEDCDLSIRASKYGKALFSDKIRVNASARRMIEWGMWKYFRWTMANMFNYYLFNKGTAKYEQVGR